MRVDPRTSAIVRQRVIECLELFASVEEQRDFESRVPGINVPGDMFCLWSDCCGDTPDALGPAFSEIELAAVRRFNVVYERVHRRMPTFLRPLRQFQATPECKELADAAEDALRDFRRGDEARG